MMPLSDEEGQPLNILADFAGGGLVAITGIHDSLA